MHMATFHLPPTAQHLKTGTELRRRVSDGVEKRSLHSLTTGFQCTTS